MRLRGLGARAAETWFEKHWNDLDEPSTLDLDGVIGAR